MATGLFTLRQVNQALRQGAWSGTQKTSAVNYLVVAGGGGAASGGAGAGGLLTGAVPVATGSSITVTVGAGGAGGITNTTAGVQGGDSVFGSITASGGAKSNFADAVSFSGGSGSGTAATSTIAYASGQGIAGQGNAGGGTTNLGSPYPGGGGGGAGTAGLNGITTLPGNGGAGIASVISGTVTAYAGGGGGGAFGTATASTGGVGGGGAGGASGGGAGVAGTANTGGGGGGGNGGTYGGGAGGSGIVIVSYPDVYAAATTTTGSPTVSTSGSGSLSFNGSSQFLSVPTVSGYTLNADFTIEFWANATSYPSTGGGSPCPISSTNTTSNWLVLVTASAIGFFWNGSSVLTVTPTNTTGDWYHVAIVRSGSTVTIYKNGVSLGTATNSSSFTSTSTMNIGQQNTGVGYWAGLLSNVRFVKGTAVYTSNFTPPTAPLAPITNTTLLLSTVSGAQCSDSSVTSAIPNSTTTVAPTWNASSPFSVTGYKNRVYTWTSSGTITF